MLTLLLTPNLSVMQTSQKYLRAKLGSLTGPSVLSLLHAPLHQTATEKARLCTHAREQDSMCTREQSTERDSARVGSLS